MPAYPTANIPQANSVNWQQEYIRHLRFRMNASRQFIAGSPKADNAKHLRSFLALLDEARRYPETAEESLALIQCLHPAPLKLGLGSQWISQMQFAIKHLPADQSAGIYRNDLAEFLISEGKFQEAVNETELVLADVLSNGDQISRACRIQFRCFRDMGQPDLADQLVQQQGPRFNAFYPASQVPPELVKGWLWINICRLELLREQGKVDEALKLANEMIDLDVQAGSPDGLMTAELFARRSTLEWVTARYPRAVADVNRSIELYRQEDDLFNAESLQSNLGLIYWTMGEFDLAEKALWAAINYFRRTGALQLLTYDLGNMGLVQFARGNLQLARQWTEEQIAHADKIGFFTEYYRGRSNLGDILYYFGEYDRAIEEHAISDAFFEKRGSREGYGMGVVWVACCNYQLGRKEAALQQLQDVLFWTIENRSRVLEALTRRCLAHFLPFEEREAHLQISLNLVRTQGRQLEEAACLLALAQVTQDEAHRQEIWQEGVGILKRIGATAWLKGHSIDDPPFIPMFV